MKVLKDLQKGSTKFFARIDWPNHFMAFISTLLGVWLAFSLGNYYEHQREISRMEVAMTNVHQEILKNQGKVDRHIAHLDSLLGALGAFSKMINDDMNLIAGANQMQDFMDNYGWFMSIEIQKPFKDTLYEYDGNLNLNLQYMSVSNIAWENTKLMDVLHLVKTETAFQLHGLYGLQAEAQRALNEAIDIIKNLFQKNYDSDSVTRTIINDLKGQIQFSYGLEKALQMNYDAILEKLME